MSDPRQPPPASPGRGDAVSGRVSDVSGGQVAIGNKIVQIDATQGAQVVINEGAEVTITRRPSPVMRPAPAFGGLIGRRHELAAIAAALEAGRSVEVVGPSGIGKTSVLRAASNGPLPGCAPDGVVAVPAQLGVAESLSYVFDACYEGARRVVPRREELTSSLQTLRLVVVLDDPGLDREALDLLRQALPSSVFLLSAHEQRIYTGSDVVTLAGLPDDDGVALIAAAVGRPLTDREVNVGVRVTQVLRGTPLELVRFASLVRSDTNGDLVSVARGFGVDAQPADVLMAVQRSTTTAEDSALAALAAFGAPVGASLVAAMSGRADAGELLTTLAERGLVTGDDLQGWRLRERQPPPPEDRHRAAVVLTEWILERDVPEEVAGEIPAIVSVLESCQRDQRWDDAVSLAAAAERPLALAARWSAWEQTLETGLGAAEQAHDPASARFFAHQLEVVREAQSVSIAATMGAGNVSTAEVEPSPPVEHDAVGPPPHAPDGHDDETARPWWKSPLAVVGLVAALVVVGLAAVLLSRGEDNPPPPVSNGGEVLEVAVEFGDVTLDAQQVLTRPLPLPEAEPPLEVTAADGPFSFELAPVCLDNPVDCTVDVLFRPTETGDASASVEVIDADGDVVATVLARGTASEGGEPPVTACTDLAAFTLAEQPDVPDTGVLAVGQPERRRIHVQNRCDVSSGESVLQVEVLDGPAVVLDPGIQGCALASDQMMECRVGPIPPGAPPASIARFDVVLQAQRSGDVLVVTRMLSQARDLLSDPPPRRFTAVEPTPPTTEPCPVPDLRGVDAERAEAVAAEQGFVVEFRTIESAEAPGVVVEQEPGAGTPVDCGSTIVLFVSGGVR